MAILVMQNRYQAFRKQGTETNLMVEFSTRPGLGTQMFRLIMFRMKKNNRIISNKGVLTRSGAVISFVKFMPKNTALMASPKFFRLKSVKF